MKEVDFVANSYYTLSTPCNGFIFGSGIEMAEVLSDDFQLHVTDSLKAVAHEKLTIVTTLSTPCNGFGALPPAERPGFKRLLLSTPCNGFGGLNTWDIVELLAFNSM
jgi:hypothetical protein